jgi:hypothetical protein
MPNRRNMIGISCSRDKTVKNKALPAVDQKIAVAKVDVVFA